MRLVSVSTQPSRVTIELETPIRASLALVEFQISLEPGVSGPQHDNHRVDFDAADDEFLERLDSIELERCAFVACRWRECVYFVDEHASGRGECFLAVCVHAEFGLTYVLLVEAAAEFVCYQRF